MKLIVGLGNPGVQYRKTRHNAGFLVLNQLRARYGWTDFLYQKKYDAEMSTGLIHKRQVLGSKPQTFMNRSGKTIGAVSDFYKISPNNVLTIQDDIDLPFGKIKLKYGGSHGGHNGIRDTIKVLGTPDFRRLKIGVGRPDNPKFSVVDYVLGSFSAQELLRFENNEEALVERVEMWLKNTGGEKIGKKKKE